MPTITAVKWDDEGVESHEFPVITQGKLVNYHSSRESASALQASAPTRNIREQQGAPRMHGCAVAPDAGCSVMIRPPHLTVAPSPTMTTVKDLCADVSHGLFVRETPWVNTDQQLASGSLFYGRLMLEIEKGQFVRRIEGSGIQFGTAKFWKSLTMLGGARTMRTSDFEAFKGLPWRMLAQSATAPAGLFKDVDVISTKVNL
jgi:TldD protein